MWNLLDCQELFRRCNIRAVESEGRALKFFLALLSLLAESSSEQFGKTQAHFIYGNAGNSALLAVDARCIVLPIGICSLAAGPRK
jgi:hypothetical protein